MARNRETKIELNAYDDLFQTDESREEAKLSKIRDIPISEIDEFPDHRCTEKRAVRKGAKRRSPCAFRLYPENGGRYECAGQAHSNPQSGLPVATKRCRTDFADIQNKKECGGNRQWQNHYLRNWAANTKGKGII